MPHTTGKRYAVVSCHVERPLEDDVWRRLVDLLASRPGGFRIAALVRPPDPAAGEDESSWLERARAAAALGPYGLHTHWTSPGHARPTSDGAAGRVAVEGEQLHRLGLAPTLFCGGGWYTDLEVAETCARLGLVDCTPRATRPPYLPPGEPWASLDRPARIDLPSGATLGAVPTTHSLGDLVRALRRRAGLPPVVHVYFHDTDLRDRRRRLLLRALLPGLARLSEPTDLDALAATALPAAPRVPWAEVSRA